MFPLINCSSLKYSTSGLSIALWMLENKDKGELEELDMVLEQMQNNLRQKKTIEQATLEDFSCDLPDCVELPVVVEGGVDEDCCGHVTISSEGVAQSLYPHILGDYKHIGHNTYIKPSTRPVYLNQPEHSGRSGYSWGVSHSQGARWGYIRSAYTSPCPTRAGVWKVFNRYTKIWVLDSSLQVLCSGK